MKDLAQLRKEIEQADEELIKALTKRMNLSKQIGEYKKANNLPVCDLKREAELKNINANKVDASIRNAYLEVFETILKVSKDLQL